MNRLNVFEVEVNNEKYYISVVGIKFSNSKSLEHVLETVSSIESSYNLSLVLVNPKILATEIHGVIAAKYALKSFKHRTNVSKNLDLETLVYISANRQIKEAISIAGPGGIFSSVSVVIISKNPKSIEKALEELLQREQGTLDNSLLDITKDKVDHIREVFSIKDEELKVTLAETQEEALVKCTLSRLALFHIKK